MTALAAALLAASLGAPPDPLPDGKTIEALSFRFVEGAMGLGPGGRLGISKDGKVGYSHATQPSTGSGGVITQKELSLTKEEQAELFRKLVADGLFKIPEKKQP